MRTFAYETKPAKEVVEREWTPWDAAVEERRKDKNFQFAATIEPASLNQQDVQRIARAIAKIKAVERSWSRGKVLTEEKRVKMRESLEEASLVLWGTPTDSKGQARLNRGFMDKLENGTITAEEGAEVSALMQRILRVKLCLGRKTKLTDKERAALGAEFDKLVAISFEQVLSVCPSAPETETGKETPETVPAK